MTVAVVGGGAAGFFAAIRCKELAPGTRVMILEKGQRVLTKVAISGGGRCNVTHATFDPRELATRYPRGGRELVGPLTRFGPAETIAWFAERGIALKVEDDGRVFPVSDRSQTIVDCLVDEARRLDIEVQMDRELLAVTVPPSAGAAGATAAPDPRVALTVSGGSRFALTMSEDESVSCDRLLIATGGHASPARYALLAGLGHTIREPVPSLFTFRLPDDPLTELTGVSVPRVKLRVADTSLAAEGPLLITHGGLSGPAVLVLSAWGARELHAREYRFHLLVNWAPDEAADAIEERLRQGAATLGHRHVRTAPAIPLPRRLWEALAARAGIAPGVTYGELTKTARRRLVAELSASSFAVSGRSPFKEEFVTCGGVELKEVDFRTMESRIVPGLHFAGEVLDIDAVTGGFNFQAAWTTGWLAGEAMAAGR